ncbi:MAG: alpha/beta hydrolase [Chlamydiia bacterium]|nr:alpha/beta hydrolase [Chlamydiia bacterium]MCP5509326.1 alpha/beta hydrolase [Chlamydiales bacterium]
MRYLLIFLFTCNLYASNNSWIPVISDRENFQFSDAISEHTQIKLVDLNRVGPTQRITVRDLLSSVRGKNLLLITHGFNMTYTYSLDQFTIYHKHFHKKYDQIIGYLWPGGNQWWEYRHARRRTLDELPYRLLATISQLKAVSKNVDILAHSMGCRLTLEMLNLSAIPLVRNLFLTAPAVSSTALQLDQTYHEATHNSKHVYVFHSKNDEVASYAFPIVEGDRSLGLEGAKHPDLLPFNVTMIDCSHCVDSHSGYDNALFFKSYVKKILSPKS